MATQLWPLPISHDDLAEICRRHNVVWMALFGSSARGEASDESDYDFIIDFAPEAMPSLFDLIRMQHELEDKLGRPVDLGTRSSIKPFLRKDISDSAVQVYAKR